MPHLSLSDLRNLVIRSFVRHGMSPNNAAAVTEAVVAAERDGSHSHGLFRLPGYISTLRSGWVDGNAVPIVEDAAPGIVTVDGANGFAQPALAAARPLLARKAREQGIALLAIRNSHHFAALWPDVEGFAEEGFVALAFLHSRARIVPAGGDSKLFGTNPMAFACPNAQGDPVVWDQASAVMANGDIQIAAQEGRILPEPVGLDMSGRPTADPREVLASGMQLAFGGHKGSMIAMMVEIMSAAITGARFGFEDESAGFPGAKTSNAGETIILIDPGPSAGQSFAARAGELFDRVATNGKARLPGARRHKEREANRLSLNISEPAYRMLMECAGEQP